MGETVDVRAVLGPASAVAAATEQTWTLRQPTTADGRETWTIPLTGSSCGDVTTGTTLLSTGEQVQRLSWTCEVDGSPALTVTLDPEPLGLLDVGAFTGTVTAGDVELTVTALRAAPWWWALAVVALGLLLAVAARQWEATSRPVRRVRHRIDAVAERAVGIDEEFRRAAGQQSWTRYALARPLVAETASLRRRLDGMGPRWLGFPVPWTLADEQVALDAIVARLTELESLADSWPRTPASFAQLMERRDGAGEAADLAEGLVDEADRLLLTPALGERGEVTTTSDEVALSPDEAMQLQSDLTTLAESLALLPTAHELRDRLDVLQRNDAVVPDEQAPLLEGARRRLRLALVELGAATDSAHVRRAGVDDLLRDARRRLLQIEPVDRDLGSGQSLGHRTRTDRGTGTPLGWVGRLTELLQLGPPDSVRTRAVDLVWFVLACLAAAWAALAALYIGKAWGSPADHAAMLALVAGGATLLAPVFAALDRLVDRSPAGASPREPDS